ncbi:MAG: hypothetical protein ABI647_17195 [Gemmatimonadota bacterium]
MLRRSINGSAALLWALWFVFAIAKPPVDFNCPMHAADMAPMPGMGAHHAHQAASDQHSHRGPCNQCIADCGIAPSLVALGAGPVGAPALVAPIDLTPDQPHALPAARRPAFALPFANGPPAAPLA